MNRINGLLQRFGNACVGRRLDYLEHVLLTARQELDRNALLLGRLHAARVGKLGQIAALAEAEFKVFSQSGEDGIIQYLINKVPIGNDTFVEIGVEDYRESNTRFLLVNNNWRGLVVDNHEANIRRIRQDEVCIWHELHATCATATRENVNDVLEAAGFTGDIGLLSIDIDGNDYWVWEALETVSPRIVVCEYNSLFGSRHAVTVPYDPGFAREKAHFSFLYFGASLPALCRLAERKGYVFVGANSAGVNAFFVRKDVAGGVRARTASEGYRRSRIREARDQAGRLSFVSGDDRTALIQDMQVLDVESDRLVRLGAVLDV